MSRTVSSLASGPEETVRKVGGIMAGSSLLIVVANEICQRLVARDIIDNHLLFGYLSDVFAVPFTVGLTNTAGTGPAYWLRPLVFGVCFALLEFAGRWGAGTWDQWDMVCYALGAVFSYAAMMSVALRGGCDIKDVTSPVDKSSARP